MDPTIITQDYFTERFFLVLVSTVDEKTPMAKITHGHSGTMVLVRPRAIFMGILTGGVPDLKGVDLEKLAKAQSIREVELALTGTATNGAVQHVEEGSDKVPLQIPIRTGLVRIDT